MADDYITKPFSIQLVLKRAEALLRRTAKEDDPGVIHYKEITLNETGRPYFENDLVVAKQNGTLFRPDQVTTGFARFLRHNDMPHIRFHDLRHSAATNMHELTGDFYTAGEILGHTLKGIGLSLGISTNMADVTARYVDVRLDRKRAV